MKRLIGILISFLLAVSVLCSCTPIVIPSDQPTETTGKDIFTPTQQPTEDIVTPTSFPSETQNPDVGGYFTFIMKSDNLQSNEYGPFIRYDGGELSVSVDCGHTGVLGQYGTGVLIFVDGQPQPYKTSEENSYSYMHTFYHQNSVETLTFLFTPIVGNAGDTLECYIVPVFEPDRTRKSGTRGSPTQYTVGPNFQICFDKSAPQMDFAKPAVMLSDVSIEKINCPYEDIAGLSEKDLREKIKTRALLDGSALPEFYDVTNSHPLELEVQIWGSPYVNFGLVYFVDYQPVTDSVGNPFFFDVESGKKTVLRTLLDMSDFEEERVVFAVLVPRNRRTSEVQTDVRLVAMRAFYLLS